MDRKKYWNQEYFKYWKAKVNEANSKKKELIINKNDIKTASDEGIYIYLNRIDFVSGSKILDVGCGFGRFYPYFKKRKLDYYGVDISEAMIRETRKVYSEIVDKLNLGECEKLPFKNEEFDYIFCFGVFDACYQEKALEEMIRVLKINGKILFTGKNYLYYDDDDKALIAEKNARGKGHPNYFTNVKNMVKQLENNDITIINQYYFKRRGDFTDGSYVKCIPDIFYEYMLLIEKNKKCSDNINLNKFSYNYSKTFLEYNEDIEEKE